MATLVCEGLCNAGRVQQFDRHLGAVNGRGAISAEMLMMARHFVHTAHEHVVGDTYKCVECGTERKFGSR